jgi:hypothetical protein
MSLLDCLEYIRKEGRVIKDAPLAAVLLVAAGWFIGQWYYGEISKENTRLKSTLRIENPQNSRPFIELTNKELRKRGVNAVQTIRSVVSYHQEQYIELNTKRRKKEVTEIQFQESREREDKRATDELTDKVKVEALMIFDELFKREPGVADMQIGFPRLNPADQRDESPSLYRIMLDIHGASRFADNIEELVKALPD